VLGTRYKCNIVPRSELETYTISEWVEKPPSAWVVRRAGLRRKKVVNPPWYSIRDFVTSHANEMSRSVICAVGVALSLHPFWVILLSNLFSNTLKLWDFRFSRRRIWKWLSSRMLRSEVSQKFTYVSEVLSVFIIRVMTHIHIKCVE
jgi:hypothetical protein